MIFETQRIEECVTGQMEPEPFSGAVRLNKGDDVLFEQAYGFAVRSESIPNRVDTRFQTASGCKVFTSVAVCQLVDRGLLQFDTRLSDCITLEFLHYDPRITVRDLLTHSSGITSYFEEDVDDDYEALWQSVPMYRIREPKDFLPLFRQKRMKFPPGERFDYNDGGFILLGIVIESLTGLSFSEYVQEHVFAPARMIDSGYFATDQLPARTAYAYIENPDGTWRTNFFAVPIVGAPDGGAYTTAPDMARFWKALFGQALLSPDTTQLLLEPQIATLWEPPYTHYGYGVWIDQREGSVKKYFVEGSDPGVALRSAFYPGSGSVLTVISNTAHALWPLCSEIERVLAL